MLHGPRGSVIFLYVTPGASSRVRTRAPPAPPGATETSIRSRTSAAEPAARNIFIRDIAERLPRVVVKAALRLASQVTSAHHVFEKRSRRVTALPELVVQRIQDGVGHVEADDVHQLEGSHRVTATEFHRSVDVLRR